MNKRILSALLCVCVLVSYVTVAAKDNQDIVILYESDVHCAVDGYEAEETAVLINDTTYISYDAVALLGAMRK